MEVEKYVPLEEGCAFISTRNKGLWIHSRLIWIKFDRGKPPENSDYRYKDINLKKNPTKLITYILPPQA